MSPRRRVLLGVTFGAFVLCALLPGTRLWVRRTTTQTVRAIVCPPIPNDGSNDTAYWTERAQTFRRQTELDRAVAAQTPADFPVQLAVCLNSVADDYADFKISDDGTARPFSAVEYESHQKNRDERVALKLKNLAPRFDENPSYHAALLRYLSFTSVYLQHRSDEAILYDASRAKAIRSQTTASPPAPENLMLWHTNARTGERLEPNNAYFPFMEAAALFAEHRDADALNALHRASTKNAYNDHALDEADGYARLHEAESEPQTAYERLNGMQAVRLPHFTLLRACARLAVAKAVEAELKNRTDDGFRIRRDVRRIGSNLRQNAPSVVGSQVGSALVGMTDARPGGAPVQSDTDANRAGVPGFGPNDMPPPSSQAVPDSNYAAEEKRYETYLRRIGHADEAQAFAFEIAEQKSNLRLTEHADENPAYYFYPSRLLWLFFVPQLVPFLLLNALFLLLLGGIAQMLARTRRIANDVPLPRAVRAGVGSAIYLPIGGALLGVGADTFWTWAGPELALACATGCGVLVGLALTLCARRRARAATVSAPRRAITDRVAGFLARCRVTGTKGVVRTVGLWTLGLNSTYLVAAFFAYAGYEIVLVAQSSIGELGLLGIDDYAYQTGEYTFFWTIAVCLLATPSLLLLFFAACSPKAGVPALAGMVRGMRGLAVPVACGLVSLTVPLFVWLAYTDANLNRDINRAMQNENRTIAEISGKLWPLHAAP